MNMMNFFLKSCTNLQLICPLGIPKNPQEPPEVLENLKKPQEPRQHSGSPIQPQAPSGAIIYFNIYKMYQFI